MSTERHSESVENYLKTIFLLSERWEGVVGVSALAERLRVSSPSVSGMIRKLVDAGLVDHARYAGITLTPAGRSAALAVVRRHRLLEMFLVTELDLAWDEVHEEAEELEHAVSDRLLERIDSRLGHPRFDPHGDPIPGRDGDMPEIRARRLPELKYGEGGDLVRVDDTDPEVLRFLDARDVRLGDRLDLLTRKPFDGPFVVRLRRSYAEDRATGEAEEEWGPTLASALWVGRAETA
ncbi:metal-dependent transcriptional regulator [Pseudonocardia parietis]|uniref:Manganese transport regulator n=1 Tax=Pseudonocardia parietis TaxID=570936 RepID=A0ABS4VK59_9PSEU|nr:metal-dependent transcriptional regulator [Pseudonocardia parietis]MBP2364309.1 DtxR family Mn-dependent transcriptional regulator [Pseudonocardia parietis]